MNKAIFIDKDGTLVDDVPYNVDPTLIRLQPHVLESLKLLQQSGYLLFIVSNQPGVALGYFTQRQLEQAFLHLENLLGSEKISIAAIYYCPHLAPSQEGKFLCQCRKPLPGMLLKAALDFKIDLVQSWMIGDILNDVEAGKNAGCKTILLDNGNETEWKLNDSRTPEYKVTGWEQIPAIILG